MASQQYKLLCIARLVQCSTGQMEPVAIYGVYHLIPPGSVLICPRVRNDSAINFKLMFRLSTWTWVHYSCRFTDRIFCDALYIVVIDFAAAYATPTPWFLAANIILLTSRARAVIPRLSCVTRGWSLLLIIERCSWLRHGFGHRLISPTFLRTFYDVRVYVGI